VYPSVVKLGFSTASQASADELAEVVTPDMSSWYIVLPEMVKRTLVSWSSTAEERELPRVEGAEVVDWVDHELPEKE
jgi:hypothetical protein